MPRQWRVAGAFCTGLMLRVGSLLLFVGVVIGRVRLSRCGGCLSLGVVVRGQDEGSCRHVLVDRVAIDGVGLLAVACVLVCKVTRLSGIGWWVLECGHRWSISWCFVVAVDVVQNQSEHGVTDRVVTSRGLLCCGRGVWSLLPLLCVVVDWAGLCGHVRLGWVVDGRGGLGPRFVLADCVAIGGVGLPVFVFLVPPK